MTRLRVLVEVSEEVRELVSVEVGLGSPSSMNIWLSWVNQMFSMKVYLK